MIGAIKAIIAKLNISDQEAQDMTQGFSGGRTTHVSSLHLEEGKAMIRHLKSRDPQEKKAEVMRRKIISMAHEMRWELPTGKADMKRIDAWMVKSSYLHKKLNQYQYNELPKLISQFEAVYLSHLKNL